MGKDAEYIRNGLVFDKFWDNCNKFLRECSIPSLTFMVTYNALSVFNDDILAQRFLTKIYLDRHFKFFTNKLYVPPNNEIPFFWQQSLLPPVVGEPFGFQNLPTLN